MYDKKGNIRKGLRANSKHYGSISMSAEVRADMKLIKAALYDYFYEPNQQLYKLLSEIGVEFEPWEDIQRAKEQELE